MAERAIGGFLPLDSEPTAALGGALDHWGITETNAWMFANARSALAHLIRVMDAERVLLPAYICPELAEAARTAAEVAFYKLEETLSPDVADLASRLRSRDCVVGVDFFGRPPGAEFRAFVTEHPDILWVEDRAQALDTGITPWADWQLFSPRKLFGVSDGGILMRVAGEVEPASYATRVIDREAPRRSRRDDDGERDSETWYSAYRAVEAGMTTSCEPMSELSYARLHRIDMDSVIAKRRENFAALAEKLPEFAYLRERSPEFAPLGFPVRTSAPDRVARHLSTRRVFAARYWPRLPSESAIFPAEHALNRELLMLPCDHRYSPRHMACVASRFCEAVR